MEKGQLVLPSPTLSQDDQGSSPDWTTMREQFLKQVLPKVKDMDDFAAIFPHLELINEDIVLADKLEPQGKSAEKYEAFKSEGNQAFKSKKYKEAIKSYNLCVLHAAEKAELSIALNNRAAAFFYNNNYQLAALDSISALTEGYPKQKSAKVCERISKSLESLGVSKAVDDNLDDVIDTLGNLKLANSSNKKLSGAKGKFVAIDLKCNPKFDGLTEKADVKISPKAGRYVEAIASVDVGEIILSESPFVAVLNRDLYGEFCHHCFSAIVAAVPCEKCSGVAFCSLKCRSAAASYHNTECQIMDAIQNEVFCVYGLKASRFITRIPLQQFLEETKNVFNDVHGQTTVSLYERVLASERHPELITPDICFRFVWTTVYVVNALKRIGYFGDALQDESVEGFSETEMHVAKCVYRFLHLSEYNSASVNYLDLESSNYRYTAIGTSVYPSTNNMNHDCNPNTISVNIQDKLILVATRPIKEGEEITLSYGPHFRKQSSDDRQKSLLKRFGFTCTCECCTKYGGLSTQDLATKFPFTGFEQFFCLSCNIIVKVDERCKSCKRFLPDQAQLSGVYQGMLRDFEALKSDEKHGHEKIDQIEYLEKILGFLHGIFGTVCVEGMNATSLYTFMLRHLAALSATE